MRRGATAIAGSVEVLSRLAILKGQVIAVDPDGELLVENVADRSRVVCAFLRVTSSPLPEIHDGDLVLFVSPESSDAGYVLGLIEKYASPRPQPHVKIEADERIELRCGQSSLTLTKEGRVSVKGVQLVSRASGVNKIKGAAVKIN